MCVVPTTTGEFLYEKTLKISIDGTDGDFVCFAVNAASAVAAILAAKEAIVAVDGVAPMGYGLSRCSVNWTTSPHCALRSKTAKSLRASNPC